MKGTPGSRKRRRGHKRIKFRTDMASVRPLFRAVRSYIDTWPETQGRSQTCNRRESGGTLGIVRGNAVSSEISIRGWNDWKERVVDLRISNFPVGRLRTLRLTCRVAGWNSWITNSTREPHPMSPELSYCDTNLQITSLEKEGQE